MTKATIKIKDKRRRIYIPEEIWEAERLEVGDFVEVDMVRIDEHKRPKG